MKDFFLRRLYSLFRLFDFKQNRINEIIQEEIKNGGVFEQLLFPVDELNNLHVIQFFKEHEEYGIISGLGADEKIEMAYLKSIVEYFERMAFFKNEKKENLFSTNGIAAHRIKEQAMRSAENELFERDSFLRHWYTNTGLIALDLTKEESNLADLLLAKGLEIFLAKTYLGFQETLVCFLKDKETKGFVVGLSSGKKTDRDKAIQEALINYFFGDQGLTKAEQLASIEEFGVNSLVSHRAYWLYKLPMPEWILKTDSKVVPASNQLRAKSNFSLLENQPFPVVVCKNDQLLDLYAGDVLKATSGNLTVKGINVVLGTTQIHPIP